MDEIYVGLDLPLITSHMKLFQNRFIIIDHLQNWAKMEW